MSIHLPLSRKVEISTILFIALFCSMEVLFSQETRELFVIDRSFEVSDFVLYNLGADKEVVILEGDEDHFEKLTKHLKEYSDLTALHLFIKGKDGILDFNGTTLKPENMHEFIPVLREWKDSFTDDADLMIYTCSYAGSNKGKGAVRRLAAYTGLDIAASVDPTGCSEMKRDWNLEFKKGIVESHTFVDQMIIDPRPDRYQAMK